MENNDDSESSIMSMRKFVKDNVDECNDIEFLDFLYRLTELRKKE